MIPPCPACLRGVHYDCLALTARYGDVGVSCPCDDEGHPDELIAHSGMDRLRDEEARRARATAQLRRRLTRAYALALLDLLVVAACAAAAYLLLR